MSSINELAERVREARKAMGLTQADFARKAGVGARTYQMFEGAKSVPQPANLRAILRAAGLDETQINPTGDPTAVAVVRTWPADVSLFLDVMGDYLVSLNDDDRAQVMRDVTRSLYSR